MRNDLANLLKVSLTLILFLAAQVAIPGNPGVKRTSLVIIAPGMFHSALADYVKAKETGRRVELFALEQILETAAGRDEPEKLKRFLYEHWRKTGFGFVLLVGDADVLPVRYMVLDRVTAAAMDYAFYPSDLYYSDLAKRDGSFDDWNAKTNTFHGSYFGEVRGEKNKGEPINFDGVDYLPDIAVGRWPVSTAEEVRVIAQKSAGYGKTASRRARKATFVAVDGWVDCRAQMNTWSDEIGTGWAVEKLYYSDAKPPTEPDRVPTHKNVRAAFGSGTSLIVHTGHGQPDAWEKCFDLTDLEQLQNETSLPLVISAGCSTAYFAPLAPYDGYVDISGVEHKGTDKGEVFQGPPPMAKPFQNGRFNPTGLGEQLLKRNQNGAVVYIGCNTGSQPCALDLVEGFLLTLKGRKPLSVGESWMAAIRHYHQKQNLPGLKPDKGWYPPSVFFQGMKFMFFGDPTLPLPGAADASGLSGRPQTEEHS